MASNFWEGKNVFVTGANGFLGSWVVTELHKKGAQVVGLVRDWNPKSPLINEGWHKKILAVRANLTDLPELERILNEYDIDTVFHIGAQTQVPTAYDSPLSTFESNIRGSWNVLEAARRSKKVKRVVVASSDKAYGTSLKLPYREEDPLQGIFPYDVSKVCADLLARSYHVTYGLPVAVTRLSNIYGGGDLNPLRLIPRVCQKIIKGESPEIYGDGSVIRDFIYVEDAVDAYLTLAENVHRKDVAGHAFNFGNDSPMSVLSVVNSLLKIGNNKLDPLFLEAREAEIKEQYLSFEKAKNILDWKPKTSMEEGLKKTFDWYKTFSKSSNTKDEVAVVKHKKTSRKK